MSSRKIIFSKKIFRAIDDDMSLDKNIKNFGKRLAALRKEKGLTQQQLADKIQVSRRVIAYHEVESDNPPSYLVVLLAGALNISADELLGVKPIKKESEKPNMSIIRRMKRIEKLSPSKQKILLQTIDTFLKGADK